MLHETGLLNTSLFRVISMEFTSWKHRSNYISLDQFLHNTGLNKILLNARHKLCDKDDFLNYSEAIVNLISLVNLDILETYNLKSEYRCIAENITNVLTQLNFKIVELNDVFRIVENDWKVSTSSEFVGDDYNLGEQIYLYNHRNNSGDLHSKSDILCRLNKYIEANKNKLNANGYSDLVSNINFMANKLDIRHAPSKDEKILIEGLTNDEIEQLYDNLFELHLDAIVLLDYISKKKVVDDLKDKLVSIGNRKDK